MAKYREIKPPVEIAVNNYNLQRDQNGATEIVANPVKEVAFPHEKPKVRQAQLANFQSLLGRMSNSN